MSFDVPSYGLIILIFDTDITSLIRLKILYALRHFLSFTEKTLNYGYTFEFEIKK